MPRAGSSAQKVATRRVQNTLQVSYTQALRWVEEKKTPEMNWGQAADAVIQEQAGTGFPLED